MRVSVLLVLVVMVLPALPGAASPEALSFQEGRLPGRWQVEGKAEQSTDPVRELASVKLTQPVGGPLRLASPEATLEPGRYRVTTHYFNPQHSATYLETRYGEQERAAELHPADVWQMQAIEFDIAEPAPVQTGVRMEGGSSPVWVEFVEIKRLGEPIERERLDVDVSQVRGASIDESVIDRAGQTLEVGDGQRYPTLAAAWEEMQRLLEQGTPVRIRIHPGVYREGGLEVRGGWLDQESPGPVRSTPLVIEAAPDAPPGSVVVSGSDVFAAEDWTAVRSDDGQLMYYTHPWPHDFGFNPGGWKGHNPKRTMEHRRELAFLDGQPLKQVELEVYEHIPAGRAAPEGTVTDPHPGVPQDTGKYGYYVFQRQLDPAKALLPGTFGVIERDDAGSLANTIVVRPPDGVAWERAVIEVGVRPHLMWFHWKDNLVLRGLTFQHAPTQIESMNPVQVGHWHGEQRGFNNNHILIERCRFQWNNGSQLRLNHARHVTVRDTQFLYGAYGGAGLNHLEDLLWEHNQSSYNNWRVPGGWASGAVKVHRTWNAIFRDHVSLANDGIGLWFDITCGNVLVDEPVLMFNQAGFDWEISRGVKMVRGLVAMNRQAQLQVISGADPVFESSIFYGPAKVAVVRFQASERTSDKSVLADLGLAPIDTYALENMAVRRSVIAAPDQTPLFFQEHGGPHLYKLFLREELELDGNLWHAADTEAFGLQKVYDAQWKTLPPRNVMLTWSQWRSMTGADGPWEDPGFLDPAGGDFRVSSESPLQGRDDLPLQQVEPALIAQYRAWTELGLADWYEKSVVGDVE